MIENSILPTIIMSKQTMHFLGDSALSLYFQLINISHTPCNTGRVGRLITRFHKVGM